MIKFAGLNLPRARILPIVQQSEEAECGLACLTMIAAFHGHHVDLNGLRQQFSISMSGSTLRGLMTTADELNLSSRAIRVELDQLHKVQSPAILHWDMNHFVVLKRVRGQFVEIHDPARGHRKLSLSQVSKHFTGVALELEPTAEFEPQELQAKTRLTQLWSGIRGWKRAFTQLLLISSILLGVSLLTPLFLQIVIDESLLKSDAYLLVVICLGFAGVFLIGAVAELLRAWAILYFGNLLTYQMVGNIFRHLLKLPTSYFEKRHIGDLVSRMGSTRPIQSALTQGLVSAIIDFAVACVMALAMLAYGGALLLIVLAFTGCYTLATMALYPRLRARQEEQIVNQAREQTHLMETIRASKLVKLSGMEPERESAWRNLYGDAITAAVSAGKYQALMSFSRTAFIGLQTVAVVFIAGRMALAGDFTVGMVFAFVAYAQGFSQRVDTFVNQLVQFRLLDLHLSRLSDIVEAKRDRRSASSALGSGESYSKIEFSDVFFRYGDGDPWILEGASFVIEEGEFVAITGSSGSGKTTLLKLLLGLYPPTAGKISYGGIPQTTLDRAAWLRTAGVVMQDDTLLSGTIANNIAMFDPQIDMERVKEVAQIANVDADIMRLPMNYLSLVGDMGSTLSGGQRQRILLARALYRRPRVLLLDEGTANLDRETERAIADAIEAMPVTRIVIAHRAELIKRASRVLHVEEGKLIESPRA